MSNTHCVLDVQDHSYNRNKNHINLITFNINSFYSIEIEQFIQVSGL